MSLPFPLQLLTPWLAPDPFPVLADLPVAPRFQELLSSTDSLTRRLERLTGLSSRVRLADQSPCSALRDREEGGRLWSPEYRIPDSGIDLDRKVWLTFGERDLLFAHSQLALSGMAPAVRQAIERGEEPLGSLFLARDAQVNRLHLMLAVCHAPALAQAARLPEAHRFIVRRSLFLVAGESCGRILELFLMDLSQ
ncbi:MAG: chorismate lyase [Magnetococcales bacterium]|nr:chorismate lyase [Magnetococcales bacterium]